MYTIKKFKQVWDISLSKSYANAFKAALTNFDTFKEKSNAPKTKRPAIAGL